MSEYAKLFLKIKVHSTLWLIIGISVITAHFIPIFMLLAIIFAHEMGHAFAAKFFNWRIKSIQLLPFGGMVETEEYGNRRLKEDLIVIIAGPLQHLWLIGLVYVLHTYSFISYDYYQQFFFMNIAVLLFNLLPIWPLDGGKLLFLGLSLSNSFLDAHRFTLQLSIGCSLLCMVLAGIFQPLNLTVWIMAGFILISIAMEWRQRYYAFIRFLLERHYGRGEGVGALKPIRVDEKDSIQRVLEQFRRGCKHPIKVMKDGKERGTLDETEILHAYFSEKMTTIKIGDLLYSY